MRIEIISDIELILNFSKKVSIVPKFDNHFDNVNRQLTIYIKNIVSNSTESSLFELNIENQIGLIKSVNLIIDKSISNVVEVDNIAKVVISRIICKYSMIEMTFIRCFDEISKKLFERIYDRIKLQLILLGKEDLFNNIWLILGHKKSLHYICDNNKINDLINLFKSNQINDASPFQLIIELLTTPLPFDVSLTKSSIASNKKVSKKWGQIKYKEDIKLIYCVLAEKKLYPSDGPTVYALCEHRDYVLSVATSNHVEENILPDLKLIKADILEIFKDGLSNYSLFFRRMTSVTKSLNNSDIVINFGKLLGGIISGCSP